MLPTLTLSNLMQYNNTLFDNIVLPTGADKQQLVNTIIMQYGEMPPTAPDWSVLRYYIDNWFAAHRLTLEHLWKDYISTYEPIYNKDAYTEETRTPNISRTTNKSGNSTDDNTYKDGSSNSASTSSNMTANQSGNTIEQYKGFQSSAFNDVSKSIPTSNSSSNDSGTTTSSGNASGNSTDNRKFSETSTEKESGTETYMRHEYGNVGVTMASQMLTDDSRFWCGFNWYDITAKLWAVDNLILIY